MATGMEVVLSGFCSLLTRILQMNMDISNHEDGHGHDL